MADANDFLNFLPPSPDLVPIPSAEFPNYFYLYHGRHFPLYRHPRELRNDPEVQMPCVLPIDRYDMVRRTVLHNLVNLRLQHRNWFGPFEQRITQPGEKLVVDVGSDDGKWIEDVSDEFPHSPHSPHSPQNPHNIRFRGIEIFPSTTQAENNNAYVEVYDFQREGIRHGDACVDIVHARFQNFHILDWNAFLNDVARCLKPGGLFMSGELDISLEYPDGQAVNAPATIQLYNQVQRLMIDRGYTPDIGTRIVDMLNGARDSSNNPLFTNVGWEVHSFPMSANNANNPNVEEREISVLAMEYLDQLAKALRPFMLSTGQTPVEVDGLLQQHRRELRQMHAKMTYRVAWAERRRA